jgi:hypothetical protein
VKQFRKYETAISSAFGPILRGNEYIPVVYVESLGHCGSEYLWHAAIKPSSLPGSSIVPSLLEEDSLYIVLGVGMPGGVEDLVDSMDGVLRLTIPYDAGIVKSSKASWLLKAAASDVRSGAGVSV